MKVKVEFTIVKDIEQLIKDSNLSDEEIIKFNSNKEEEVKGYIKELECVLRDEIEFYDHTIITDFKARKVEE